MSGDRITICQLQTTLFVAGGEVLAARLAQRLSDAYRLLFVCLEELGPIGAQLRDQGFPVYVLGRRTGLDWRNLCRLARVIRNENIKLIHAHALGPFLHAALARLPYRAPPVLFTEHSKFHIDRPRPHRLLTSRFLLRRGSHRRGQSSRHPGADRQRWRPERSSRGGLQRSRTRAAPQRPVGAGIRPCGARPGSQPLRDHPGIAPGPAERSCYGDPGPGSRGSPPAGCATTLRRRW